MSKIPNADGREAALKGLHAYREEIKKKIDRFKQDVEAVERSIALLSGEDTANLQEAVRKTLGYEGLGPQRAVERLLYENPDRKFKASVAAKELLRRGYPKKGKNFASIIACALNRAVAKGIATREHHGGRWVYGLVNSTGASEASLAQN